MAQQLIYKKTKSHSDGDDDWIPDSAQGTDKHKFTIPADTKYVRYAISASENLGGYEVKSSPKRGATGDQNVNVKWWFLPFGNIKYTLRVYTGNVEIIPIEVGSNNWIGQALDAIKQGDNFKLILGGHDARNLFSTIKRLANDRFIPLADASTVEADDMPGAESSPAAPIEPMVEPITITIAIVLAIISIAAFATIAAIFIEAIHNGYNANAKHKAGATPLSDELEISVVKA
ncbi:hypothetical protein VSS37_13160 [Candidatus Thiothrix sp. Deng01]|uniref:Uncharacterized protein n=1 Tax=Candidatus Thiothrix phosphatis TaxID=3112415 RepID=A0ABU6CYT1_9GAMM|nr:hypothetical protein [Candidatus Thiothrix sp. Deng01]MEB4591935.1 hypothetical protein [Candidatus Thiothrix sp. Deng01]